MVNEDPNTYDISRKSYSDHTHAYWIDELQFGTKSLESKLIFIESIIFIGNETSLNHPTICWVIIILQLDRKKATKDAENVGSRTDGGVGQRSFRKGWGG